MVLEESGPRHTRSRGVDAASRRARVEERVRPEPISDDGPHSPSWDTQDDEELENALSGGAIEEATSRVTVRKGREGRFVS